MAIFIPGELKTQQEFKKEELEKQTNRTVELEEDLKTLKEEIGDN